VRLVPLAACLSVLLGAPAPAASAVRPLSFTQLDPPDGLQRLASSYPLATDAEMLDFFLDIDFPPPNISTSFQLEVATQNVPGQDGTLADDYLADWALLTRSDAYPTQWRTRTATYEKWLSTPGTYFWQLSATYWDTSSACTPCVYATPVRSLTISARPQSNPPLAPPRTYAPPPHTYTPSSSSTDRAPRLSSWRAEQYATGALKQEFGRSYRKGRHRRIACRSVSRLRRSCSVSWRYRTWSYKGKIAVWHTNVDWRDQSYYSYKIIRTGEPCNGKDCHHVYKY
jgi:hypothetical protein